MNKGKVHFNRLAKSKSGSIILFVIKLLLLSLWVYAATVKLGNMNMNYKSMREQIFPDYIADILVYAIPITELIIAGILLFREKLGLLLSAGLLSAFILYILVINLRIFGKIPCACGGIFQKMSYDGHLVFNIVMLLLSLTALYIHKHNKTGEAENQQESRYYKQNIHI